MNYLKEHYGLIITILICILVLPFIFYIFVGSKAWMNQDSSFIVDYAIEVLETHSIFPNTWYNSNDFWIYSLIPMITIFIKMGMSLFFSRQLSVLIQSVILFLVLYDLFHSMMKDHEGFKIVILMLLSGISGQFIFEVFGDATYGTIILFMLMSIWLFIKYQMNYEKRYLIIFGILLLILTTCSLRFPIYIGAPIICCILYAMYEKGIKKEHIQMLIICLLAIFIGYLLNYVLRHTLLFSSYYQVYNIIGDSKSIESNLITFIYNYLFISGATYQCVYSLSNTLNLDFISGSSSPLIVFIFIKFIYAIFSISIPLLLIKKIKKMSVQEKYLFIFIVSFSLIIMFFAVMGSMQWYRYITAMVFFLLLLYPIVYKYFFKKKENNQFVFYSMIILFSGVSFIFSIFSYFSFKELKIRENQFTKVVEFIESKDLSFGYTNTHNEANIYKLISNGKVEVVCLENGEKQYQWISSKRWISEDYHQGKVFFIRPKGDKIMDFEQYAIEHYELDAFYSFDIFVFENNKIILDNLGGDINEEE